MTIQKSILGPGFITFDPGKPGVKELSSQVTACTLDPKGATSDVTAVLSGEVDAGDYTEAPILSVTFLPDFGEKGSVQEWLVTNRGKTMAFDYVPSAAKGRKITGHLVVMPAPIGGTVKKADTVSVDFPCTDFALADYQA